jgi:predicted RNA-binding protein with PIN domain
MTNPTHNHEGFDMKLNNIENTYMDQLRIQLCECFTLSSSHLDTNCIISGDASKYQTADTSVAQNNTKAVYIGLFFREEKGVDRQIEQIPSKN